MVWGMNVEKEEDKKYNNFFCPGFSFYVKNVSIRIFPLLQFFKMTMNI